MNKQQLMEAHGTPEQFEKAIWDAYADLFITQEEAICAIKKYRKEWEDSDGTSNEG